MATRRRDVFVIGGAVAVAVAFPRIVNLFRPAFEFEPIPDLPQFRRLAGGGLSSAGRGVALLGIDQPSPDQAKRRADVAQNPCRAAFHTTGWRDGTVPIAVFTDYNCPYCPVFSDIVIDLAETGAPVRLIWHDLPILGPRSVAAARAALAAAKQGQYLPVHRKLMRSVLRPGPVALRNLAEEFRLDATKFVADVNSDEIQAQIDQAHAIASVFGIYGTPTALVGRTLVMGAIKRQTLQDLIDIERNTPFSGCTTAKAG